MESKRRNNIFVQYALKKPITILMFFMALLVLGYIAQKRIPVELLPQGMTPPFISVIIPTRNSNPYSVEQQITKPLEDYLGTVRRLKHIYSSSSATNARFRLQFDSNANMKLAYSQIRDRIARARPLFPDDTEQEFIWKFNLDDTPILWIGITMDEKEDDPYYLLDNFVKKALIRIDGIARVDIMGTFNKVISIDLDKYKIDMHKVNIYKLIQLLRKNNTSLFLGKVKEANNRYFVRASGHFKTLDEIRNFKIRPNLKLSDIGIVKYDFDEKKAYTRVNLKNAFYCAVYKESTANTVETSNVVKQFLSTLKTNTKLKKFSFYPLWSQGDVIQNSLDDLTQTLLWGAVLAMLVLIVFLRNLFMTVVITLSIPLSLLMTLIVMYFSNNSLNILSMMGLTLGVGMLVDNTVVVVENIERYLANNVSPMKAALYGTGEIALAITLSTATTLVVFLPLILMSEDAQFKFFMSKLGWPVCISLVASLIIAIIFVPLTTVKIKKNQMTLREKEESSYIKYYGKMLSWVIQNRFSASLIFVFVLFSTSIPIMKVNFTDNAASSSRRLSMSLVMPVSFDLEKTNKIFYMLENTFYKNRKELGIIYVLSNFNAQEGRINIFLDEVKKLKLSVKQILKKVRKLVPKIPGTKIRFRFDSSGNDQSISIKLTGPDTDTLYNIAIEVERRLRTISELDTVETPQSQAKEEIHIHLDRERVFTLGLSVPAIIGTLSYALRGSWLPDFKSVEREIPMVIRYKKADIEAINISNMKIYSATGDEVPASSFSKAKFVKGMEIIHRYNRKTTLDIKAFSNKGSLGVLRQKIGRVLKNLSFPQGYKWNLGSRFRELERTKSMMLFTFMMSITFVFLLMGILFESFILPFSIMISIPFALFGVFWMLFITGTAFQIMTGIGIVILAGIVVNNAIVLVDCINHLRKNEGLNRFEAIISGAKQRIRPILITAMTTIVGLIPMAIGKSHIIGLPYYPLGRTVIGGLAASTLLTLLVVPLFYTFCDDMRTTFFSILGKIWK